MGMGIMGMARGIIISPIMWVVILIPIIGLVVKFK